MSIKIKNNFKYKREGRIICFQALYSYDFNDKPGSEIVKFDWLEEKIEPETFEYAKFLVEGCFRNLPEIDELIINKLRNWEFNRISAVDKAILRFSLFSLLYEKDLDQKIIINEAVEIAKEFGNEDSYKFINGILDAIRKTK